MKADIIIIGGGASGLMAAYAAAREANGTAAREANGTAANTSSKVLQVTVLEKMPRPARKVMITGKGRCNFTNVKDWNEFSAHIRSKANFLKPAFFNMTPAKVLEFFESFGVETVIERGDRAFPASYHASDIVDALVNACHSEGVKIECGTEVSSIQPTTRDQQSAKGNDSFSITSTDGRSWTCRRLIIATGGLSYPTTGSTGDGYGWAEATGHKLTPTFPSLTALVPRGYKQQASGKELHIHRDTPLSDMGQSLCGVHLKNIQAGLFIEGTEADSEFGDIDFTDGGIEGPIGFQLSRKAVKSMANGSRVSISINLKPGVPGTELEGRIRQLWESIRKDPRSRGVRDKELVRILLGKLMPREIIPAFTASICKSIIPFTEKSPAALAKTLTDWRFDIAGYVGYERCVITAGGVSTDDILQKTMESRLVQGLYFCGEVLDCDCDTGGYNLQCAFSTGALAGESAAKAVE